MVGEEYEEEHASLPQNVVEDSLPHERAKEVRKMSTCILKMHSTLISLLNIIDSWFSNIDK